MTQESQDKTLQLLNLDPQSLAVDQLVSTQQQAGQAKSIDSTANPVAPDILHTQLTSQGWMFGPIQIDIPATIDLVIPKWVKALQLVELYFRIVGGGAAPAINLVINGANVTVALGGPWGAGVTVGPLNVTPYLIDGKLSQPNGNHPLRNLAAQRNQFGWSRTDPATVQMSWNLYGITQPAIGAPVDT